MRIEFYRDGKGQSQVEKFLTSLSPAEFSKVGKVLDLLEQAGELVKEPFVKSIQGKIWEIRAKAIRILYFRREDSFVLLNAFRKTTPQTPENEKKLAVSRMNDYLKRS